MDPVPSTQVPPVVQQPPAPMPQFGSTQTSTAPTSQKKAYGPVVGAIIIVALLVFGALYFWGESINKSQSAELPLILGNDPAHPTVTQTTTAPPKGDSVEKIEADLKATNAESMNTSVDASLKQAESNI